MKIVFVYWGYENAGSMLDLRGYERAARALGHEVTVYGPPGLILGPSYSMAVADADALVFVFEWTTWLQRGDRLDWVRLVGSVPRSRRVVIDCDGAYNDPIEVEGDYNHTSSTARMTWAGGEQAWDFTGTISAEASSRAWVEVCDSLTDKIYQPTPRPRRANVGSFLFHIYDPTWETPLDFAAKQYGMTYVGHTKFRWDGMAKVLGALEPVRDQVGRIALIGEGWSGPLTSPGKANIKEKFFSDQSYLEKLQIEALPPIPCGRVIETMSRAVFNPVIYRPLFRSLGMVTCRTFETPAAGTIPLFLLDEDYVRQIYGDRATELILGDDRPHEKVLDILTRPDYYGSIVEEIRRSFTGLHSPEARLRELVEIIRR